MALFVGALLLLARPAAAGAPCTGSSAFLPPLQCGAWQDLFDSLLGWQWAHCNSTRNDPCACNSQYPAPSVTCGSAGITSIYSPGRDSPAGRAVGTIPETFGQLTALTYLALRFNVWGTLPASFGKLQSLVSLHTEDAYLGGALPSDMPFSQLTDCDLNPTSNHRFACPLPEGALTSVCAMEASACGSPCTGNSKKLAVDQCLAWISFYDATGGAAWKTCSSMRTDPCACMGKGTTGDMPVCNADGTAVSEM